MPKHSRWPSGGGRCERLAIGRWGRRSGIWRFRPGRRLRAIRTCHSYLPPLRLLLPWFKKGFLNQELPAGFRIRNLPEGAFGAAPMPTDDALAQLRSVLDRLARESPARPHPIFGALTHEEWIKYNLRHAELHLSFFHPQ